MAILCEHVHELTRIAEVFLIFNFGLLWQRRKCTESPVYQLFMYFLFWTSMSENKSRPYFPFNW